MGCDIHAYIEYYSKRDLITQNNSTFVRAFSGELEFGRNYTLFGLMAGVRSYLKPLFSPRGLPKNPGLSFVCQGELYYFVYDDPAEKESRFYHRNRISRIEAEHLINSGRTEYINSEKTKIICPDIHSATYFTLPELLSIRKCYLLEIIEYHSQMGWHKITKQKKDLVNFIDNQDTVSLMKYNFSEFDDGILYATLSTMMSLEKNDDTETRFVCWFDS